MNDKKWISGLCAALALIALLPVCSRAEALSGEKTTDTQLIRELMENYLNMDTPQHESVQTQFGLVTAHTQLPIIKYEDFSRTESGDGVCLEEMLAVIDADAGVYIGSFNGEPYDAFYSEYLYPEKTMWLPAMGEEDTDAWMNHQKYYVQDKNGTYYCWNGVQYLMPTENLPVYYGFSCIPRKSYLDFLQKAVEDRDSLEQMFALQETEIYDMEKKQAAYADYYAEASKNFNSDATALSKYHHMTLGRRPCYGVSFDIPQEYLRLMNPGMLDRFFSLERRAFSSRQEALQNTAPPDPKKEHPIRLRPEKGDVHVTLYFDRDTKQCIGRKLDGTDCVKHLMDWVCSQGYGEITDGTYLVHSQYFDNGFQSRPDFLTEAPVSPAANQAVFCVQNNMEATHHIYSSDRYGLQLNFQTGLYEFLDGKDVIGTLQYYSADLEDLKKEGMVTESEKRTSKTGLSYELCRVSMGKLFDEGDPDENGYMALFMDDCFQNGVLISAWDQETAVKIMDDLHFREELLPRMQD